MIKFLFLVALVLAGISGNAQAPVANFTGSPLSGCAPLVVNFKDLSTGNPKFWNWDLGNGQLSNVQNPTAFYSVPGKYTVTLVVRNADGTHGYTRDEYIIVNPSPVASFTANITTSCVPATIQFSDLSTGNITKWEWDFGDGTTSTARNPSKTYLGTGFFTVNLRVTSSTGCQNTASSSRLIRVVSGVKAAFIDSVAKICKPPFTIDLLNQTSGPGNLTYSWTVSNGTSSTQESPKATVNADGNFSVRLIAQSDLGCKDTIDKTITLKTILTQFTGLDSSCLQQSINFKNNSSANPISLLWDFGDSTQSKQPNFTKRYSKPGTYNVKLINTYAGCTDSITKPVTISDLPVVDFTANNTEACKAPLVVDFTDLSKNAVAWEWNFGDGTTANTKVAKHTYQAAGKYDVSLTITGPFGCKNTLTKKELVKIVPPSFTITNGNAGGCAPFSFQPIARVNAIDGIAGYLWDLGNGVTSTQASPLASYPNVGSYDLKLTVTTTGGCVASSTFTNGVRVGTRSPIDFKTSGSTVCAADSLEFTDLSGPGQEWLWNFGDKTTSTDQNPKHLYDSAGTFDVTLTVTNNGCPSSLTKPAFITVQPPIAKFEIDPNCNNKRSVNFVNLSEVESSQPVTYLWEFGDAASSSSTVANPIFNYPQLGSYTVKLQVTNGSCTTTKTQEVKLSGDIADFSASKTNLCKNEVYRLTAINSDPLNIASYEWTLGNAAPSGSVPSIDGYFTSAGSYPIRLVITDIHGCSDTATKNDFIKVTGPLASFTSTSFGACKNSSVTFNDLSSPSSDIIKWNFDFGNGDKQSFTKAPFNYIYKDTGSFQVQLTVEDKAGCTDVASLPQNILITSPAVGFSAQDTVFCQGANLKFIDTSKGSGLSYLWSFGDGTTSTLKDPEHSFTGVDKNYSISLLIKDTVGCVDSSSKINYVHIKSPKPSFDIKDTTTICPPLETKFTLKASDYESYFWDFGDGGSSSLPDPTHFYNSYGSYSATLFVTGFGGCLDSVKQVVNLYNPSESRLDYNPPPSVCNSIMIDYAITTPPSTSFTFYYGDGGSDTSQQKKFQHFYSTPSVYTPFLILTDKQDCQVGVGGSSNILVLGAEPFFSMDRKKFCDSGTVYFTNYTIANDPIISDIWNFDNGITSTLRDPVIKFSQPDEYIIAHTVKTQSGCEKTIIDTVRAYRTPTPLIRADTSVCINSPVVFQAQLAVPDTATKWTWSFGNGQASNLDQYTLIYNETGRYPIKLRAENLLGCKDSASATINVHPLPAITMAKEVVMPLGFGVRLPVSYSPNVSSFKWSPPTGLDCSSCPVPLANPKFTTTYKVDVVDSNGCKSASEISVNVICNNKNYFIPNTFSPNGDGVNDVFYPRGTGIDRIQSMRIFNRWGEMVFEKRNFPANSISDGWNGRYKGQPANGDVYVYIVEFVCDNANVVTYKGNVALIR